MSQRTPAMTVDVRTRVWESSEQLGRMAEALRRRPIEPWARPWASVDEHARAMRPVTEALVLGFESRLVGASIPMETVADYVAQRPEKFIGFAGIDPTVGQPVAELERALELGLRGVAVSPVAQGFHPAATRAMELFEACADKGVPVFIETTGIAMAREAPLEFGQPHLLDEVARTFPELRIVISSLADPWIEQGLALVGKHPTVFGELSDLIQRPWQLYNALALAHQQGVMNQLLFGSGFPFSTPEKAIVTVYSVNTLVHGTHLPSVPREQLRSIVERDALKCLGLRGPGQPTPQHATDAGGAGAAATGHAGAPAEHADADTQAEQHGPSPDDSHAGSPPPDRADDADDATRRAKRAAERARDRVREDARN